MSESAARRSLARTIGEASALAVAYVALARLGLAFDALAGFASVVWPPSGLALAVLVWRGARLAPGVFVGAAIANAWQGASLPVALVIGVGNTGEALAGVGLLFAVARVRAWIGAAADGTQFRIALDRVADVAVFTVVAALVPLVSATVGVGALVAGGVVGAERALAPWSAWWTGDVIGVLVVAPLVLVWAAPAPAWRARDALPALALVAALALIVFGAGQGSAYVLMPAIVFACVRGGPRGAATAVALTAAIAIAGTALGVGPFAAESALHASLARLQVFMGFTSSVFLVAGALVAAAARSRAALASALSDTVAARAAAERASAGKTTLIQLVSHELRTPLAALTLQVQRLKRAPTAPAEAGAQDELIVRMGAQVARLRAIVDMLLEHARIENGQLVVAREAVDLAREVTRTCEDLRPHAEANGLALTADVPTDAATVQTDKRLFALVVANLVGNAIKFTEHGGVQVRLVAPTAGARSWRVEVEDTGSGIAPEDRERVFEPFEQTAPLQNKHRPGVGLGLSLSRTIAHALGGTVQISQTSPRGSTFVFEIPLGAA